MSETDGKVQAGEWLGEVVEAEVLPTHCTDTLMAGFEAGLWTLDDIQVLDEALDESLHAEAQEYWPAVYKDSMDERRKKEARRAQPSWLRNPPARPCACMVSWALCVWGFGMRAQSGSRLSARMVRSGLVI